MSLVELRPSTDPAPQDAGGCASFPTLDVRVKLELADALRGRLWLFWRRSKVLCGLYALFVVGYAVAKFNGIIDPLPGAAFGENGAPLLAAMILLPAALMSAVYVGTKRAFDRAHRIHPALRFHFCDSGVQIDSRRNSDWIAWEDIVEAVESSQGFFVFPSPNEHYLVPKRAIAAPGGVEQLREIFRAKLGSRAALR
jgi:hypothetical protein